jgi:hypothetical protein
MLRCPGCSGTGRPAAWNAPALTRAGSRRPGACQGTNLAPRSTAGTTNSATGQLPSRICPSRPRSRRGTRWDAPGGSSGRKLAARTWTTLCAHRLPASCTQDTQACQVPSASFFFHASRCPATPIGTSPSGGPRAVVAGSSAQYAKLYSIIRSMAQVMPARRSPISRACWANCRAAGRAGPHPQRIVMQQATQGGTRPWGLRCPVVFGLGGGARPGSQATDPRSGQMRTTGSWARSAFRAGSAFLAARPASHSPSAAIGLGRSGMTQKATSTARPV